MWPLLCISYVPGRFFLSAILNDVIIRSSKIIWDLIISHRKTCKKTNFINTNVHADGREPLPLIYDDQNFLIIITSSGVKESLHDLKHWLIGAWGHIYASANRITIGSHNGSSLVKNLLQFFFCFDVIWNKSVSEVPAAGSASVITRTISGIPTHQVQVLNEVGTYTLSLNLNGARSPAGTVLTKIRPGPRLNIKTVLSTYGDFHVEDKTAVRTSYL